MGKKLGDILEHLSSHAYELGQEELTDNLYEKIHCLELRGQHLSYSVDTTSKHNPESGELDRGPWITVRLGSGVNEFGRFLLVDNGRAVERWEESLATLVDLALEVIGPKVEITSEGFSQLCVQGFQLTIKNKRCTLVRKNMTYELAGSLVRDISILANGDLLIVRTSINTGGEQFLFRDGRKVSISRN